MIVLVIVILIIIRFRMLLKCVPLLYFDLLVGCLKP